MGVSTKLSRFERTSRHPRLTAGVALSLDATFRTASKATVVDNGKTHTCVYKGGITTVLNEETIILAWVRTCVVLFCLHANVLTMAVVATSIAVLFHARQLGVARAPEGPEAAS